MRRYFYLAAMVLGLLGAALSAGIDAEAQSGHAALVELDAPIMPATARFVSRAIEKAADDGARAIVIRLHTPGGLLDATREILVSIQESPIPVVVYVAPEGSHAASAGTFLTAWAHIAAMAPATTIGSASPVGAGGQDLPDTIKAKATEDALALFRGIAEERGRNAEALERTVIEAKSFSATEALEEGIIDLVAEDLDQLLTKIDGRTVKLKQGTVVLETAGIELREIKATVLERFLSFLANPDVFFILFILGGLGLLIEFVVPGVVVPGVAGVVFLALAFLSAGSLPVNLVGVALLALALGLFYVEVQAPGVGIAGVGGGICFVVGALLLFGGFTPPGLPDRPPDLPRPSLGVSLWLIAGVAAALFGLLWFVVRDLAAARKAAGSAGPRQSPLIGQPALATTDLAPTGTVHVEGEAWSAISDSGETVPEGSEVTVSSIAGLVVRVQHALEAGEFRSSRYDDPDGQPASDTTTDDSDTANDGADGPSVSDSR